MEIVSHRGIGSRQRENTIPAFAEVIGHGASIIELDLRCTLDGQLVLAHNKHMGAWGRPEIWIAMYSYAELQRIIGDNNGILETFDNFIKRFPDTATIVDIKWRGGMETLRALHIYVQDRFDLKDFIARHSLLVWLPEHLAAARELFPGICIVENRVDCMKAVARAMAGLKPSYASFPRIVSIPARCFRNKVLAQSLVRRLRGPNRRLMAYLATQGDEVELASSLCVDLLMTDDVELAFRVLAVGKAPKRGCA